MKLYSEYYVSEKCERFVNKICCLHNSIDETPIENKLVLPNGCFNLPIVNGNSIEVDFLEKKKRKN